MPATFTKPVTVPRWADDGTPGQIVVPSSGKQDLGWIFEEEPPFSFFNWHQNLTGEWLKWVDERFDDGGDENTLIIRNPDNASAFIELDGPNETIDFDGTSSPLVLDLSGTDPFFSSGLFGIGDENFQLDFNSGDPQITFDAGGDSLRYDRSENDFLFRVGGTTEIIIDTTGMRILNGLFVGDLGTTPNDNTIHVRDVQFGFDFNTANVPRVVFDSGDRIQYDRTTNVFTFRIATVIEAEIDAAGIGVRNGLHVGSLSVVPVNNTISVGDDADFRLSSTNTNLPTVFFDTPDSDSFRYNKTADRFEWLISSVAHMTLVSGELHLLGVSDGSMKMAIEATGASHGSASVEWETQTGGAWSVFMDDTALSGGANTVNDLIFERVGIGIAMVIDANGDVGIGTNSAPNKLTVFEDRANFPAAFFENDGNNSNRFGVSIRCGQDDGEGNSYVRFIDGDGTLQGEVGDDGVGGGVILTSFSDLRLKKDVAPTKVDALEVLNAIRMIEYRMKNAPDDSAVKKIGYDANSVETADSDLISHGQRRSDDPEFYKQIRTTKLIPYLVKAVQELSAQVQALQPA